MHYVRAAALLAVLGSFTFAAGCSGGSGGATPPISVGDQSSGAIPGSNSTESTTSAGNADSTASVTSDTSLSTESTTTVPRHVMTGAFVYGYDGTPASVPLSEIKPWLNWVQTDEAHAPTLRANGIKVDIYMNFWRNHIHDVPVIGYTDLKPGGAHADAEARDCSGTPIWDKTYSGGYASDARRDGALGHAQVVAEYRENEYRGAYDALFVDQADTFYGMATPCGFDENTYVGYINTVHSGLRSTMFVNALGLKSGTAVQTIVDPSNVLGAMCEECYSRDSSTGGPDLVDGDGSSHQYWSWIENAEIEVIAKHKIFWDYARAHGDAATETALRKYVYSSFLLTYSPNYAMFEEALQTRSGFEVFPEVGLVPENPLTTESTVAGYRQSTGVYMRQFADCYYLGVNHGECAVVVNPSTESTVRIPTTAYGHSLSLAGASVIDGGTASVAGSRVTELGPLSGTVLFH